LLVILLPAGGMRCFFRAGLRIHLLALLLSLIPVNIAFAATDPHQAVQDTAARLDLQTSLPGEAQPPAPKPHAVHGSASVDRIILWTAVIIGVATIFWSMRNDLPFFGRARKIIVADEQPPVMTPSARLEEAQIEADDLARGGHYSEAMHVLLLKSLNELRRHLDLNFAVSLTSREILRRVQLSELGRNALADIIQAVEETYYGGRAVEARDYAACRSRFDTLRRALAGAAS
jgi:hypothetical protein